MVGDDAAGFCAGRVLAWLKKVARFVVGRAQPAEAIGRHPFDAQYGVDTSGLLGRKRLRTGHAHDAFNTAYFGVPPSRFAGAVERWQRTPGTAAMAEYRFIDVGCGKGRAVLLASSMRFRDVVGIELHPGLAATARENLVRWRWMGRTVTEAAVVCGDGAAALPGLLRGATLVYLFNPFQARVLRELLAGVVAWGEELGAAVDVLYLYPEHEEAFGVFPEFELLWREEIALAAEDENDGISAACDPCSLYRFDPRRGSSGDARNGV